MKARAMVLALAVVMVSGCATSTRKTFGLAMIASSTVAALGFTGYAGFQQSKADDIYHVKGYSYVDGAALKEGIWQAWGIQMGICAVVAIGGVLLAAVSGEPAKSDRAPDRSPSGSEAEALSAARLATRCNTLVVVGRRPAVLPDGTVLEIHGCGKAVLYRCDAMGCWPGAEKR